MQILHFNKKGAHMNTMETIYNIQSESESHKFV
jgi:hypothetical protein